MEQMSSDSERKVRVIVADDNRDSANSLGTILRIYGHDVRVVYDGYEALAAHTDDPEAVLITDIGMPGKTGHDLAKEIRAEKHTVRCLIIAVTGYGQEHDRRLSREAGIDHHLVKPVDPQTIRSLLERYKGSKNDQ
jgi:CheY-like chemotaxis protein